MDGLEWGVRDARPRILGEGLHDLDGVRRQINTRSWHLHSESMVNTRWMMTSIATICALHMYVLQVLKKGYLTFWGTLGRGQKLFLPKAIWKP